MELDLERFLEHVPEELLVLAPDAPRFTILAASDAFLRATQSGREAVVGKGVFEVLSDDRDTSDRGAKELARASLQRVVDERCADGPHISSHEVRRREADGGGSERRYRRSLSSPVMGADGQVTCIIHQVQDVTDAVLHIEDGAELRAADRAVRTAEAALAQEVSDHGQTMQDLLESRLLLASSLEAQKDTIIFSIDHDYRYLFFNEAHAEAMRHAYGAEATIGACVLDLISDVGDRAAAKDNYDRALAGESHANVRVFGDVERAWYESFFNPVRDEAGVIIGATGLARDITERQLAEERLRQSEEDFRVLAEAVPQIVWTTTPDGKNTFFNQQWVDYTGMTLEESYGDGWNTPFHPDDRGRAWEAWQRATRDDAPYSLECRLRRADGAYRWWLVRGAPLRDESGAILQWFGTCTDINDLKNAEEALREREYLLSASQRAAHVGTWSWTVGDTTVHWSDETYRLYGLSPDMGPPSFEFYFEIIQPEDRQKMRDWAGAVAAGLHPPAVEFRVLRTDGSMRVIRTEGDAIETVDGAPSRMAGTAYDVTERVRAEEQLAQMTRLYATLSQVNQAIVRVKCPDELYSTICDVAVEFGEFTVAWVGLVDPESGDVRPVAATGLDLASWPFETINLHRGISKDGLVAMAIRTRETATTWDVKSDERMRSVLGQLEDYDYHSVAAIPITPGGEVTGALVLISERAGLFTEAAEVGLLAEMALDISFALEGMATEAARERAIAALRESEERYRQLFEGESDAVFLVDNESGRIVEANAAASCMYGYSHEEITSLRDLDLVADADRLRTDTRGSQSGRRVSSPTARMHRRKDGTTFPVEITGGFFALGDRQMRLAAIRDITERRRAEEDIRRLNAELEERVQARTAQLDAAYKELESFAYSVSHDLRAPLRAIDGFSAMVLEDAAGKLDEQDVEHLRRVRAGAERMAALIDALLGLSRASRHEIHIEEVDVSVLADQVIAELREAAPERRVETVVARGLRAETDAVLLRAILANLLSNAWKFTSRHETARIEVGATDSAEGPVFFVRDDGAGFDIDAATRLFGPFQRYHGTEEFAGDGIGLATVQRLVARLGGRVWAEAEVEKGATFSFTLPDPDVQETPAKYGW